LPQPVALKRVQSNVTGLNWTELARFSFWRTDQWAPHRGQPPWRGGGALLRWPERFLQSGG